eukprot:CAMPEP_0168512286 /NCGR_PEP_ID=MMETSP0405-20121227/2682_1 /TAXON_ID=498012 /ORGANISM="Trichosphaerium sp, Strain Am-I-7 wt" /LENGTH=141 /DNA_ID=CAMNT_0008530709 /DNA_START=884 /DNA_END=1309 /DNA_ORIENTATION=-
MTTVGYGDYTPRSVAGRLVAAFTMICSTFVLTLPMAIFLVHFTEAYANQRQIQAQKRGYSMDEIPRNMDNNYNEQVGLSPAFMRKELQLWKDEIENASRSLAKLEKRRSKLMDLMDRFDSDEESEGETKDNTVVISAATIG